MLKSLAYLRGRIASVLAGNQAQVESLAAGKSRRIQAICLLLFSLAFAVRLLYLHDNSVEIRNGETIATTLVDDYQQEALRMQEQGYLLFPPQPLDPQDARMILHPPGYSILLIWLYGKEVPNRFYTRLRLLHMVCDSFSVVVIFLIAAQLLPLTVALIGALLAALSPHLAYYSQWLTPDSVAVLPILLAIYLFIKGLQKPRLILFLAVGVSLGISCWLRANGLLLAPFLAITCLIVCRDARRWRYAAVLAASMIFVILPITIRNWVSYKHVIPLSLGSGITLIEGLGEYDTEQRFGLPADDLETGLKEAEWYGRPEYADELWRLDGLKRDRERFARGVAVMKSNPGWFAGVILRRMGFMLRYNDFKPQNRRFNHTTAPAVLAFPPFSHSLPPGEALEPAHKVSASALYSEATQVSTATTISLLEGADRLQVAGDIAAEGNLFTYAPLAVNQYCDYVLRVPLTVTQGQLIIQVKTADPRITLAGQGVLPARRKKKNKGQKKPANPGENSPEPEPMEFIHIPFTSADAEQIQIVFTNPNPEKEALLMQAGGIELSELGATSQQWTRLPRALLRGFQKNIYQTNLLRLLILAGIILLVFAGQKRTLILLLVVPLYYLCLQSALHTEYRYILAIHYFLFVLAAASVYFAGMTVKGVLRSAKARL
jgi:hypothetical protein